MAHSVPVRELLNEFRWHPDKDAANARIFYAHRGAKEGFAVTRGDEVEEVGPSSFRIGTITVPYYKVFRITYGEEVLLEREPP